VFFGDVLPFLLRRSRNGFNCCSTTAKHFLRHQRSSLYAGLASLLVYAELQQHSAPLLFEIWACPETRCHFCCRGPLTAFSVALQQQNTSLYIKEGWYGLLFCIFVYYVSCRMLTPPLFAILAISETFCRFRLRSPQTTFLGVLQRQTPFIDAEEAFCRLHCCFCSHSPFGAHFPVMRAEPLVDDYGEQILDSRHSKQRTCLQLDRFIVEDVIWPSNSE